MIERTSLGLTLGSSKKKTDPPGNPKRIDSLIRSELSNKDGLIHVLTGTPRLQGYSD